MIRGYGLHGGQPASVRFVREYGPVRLRVGEREAEISTLVADGLGRSTTVSAGALRVATVEHLFAALEARSMRSGLVIEVEGPELPLADGAARAFADALAAFDVPIAPRPRVVRAATIAVGSSTYELSPASQIHVEVAVDFDDTRIAPRASWNGDAEDFRLRIAPARTFAFEHELGGLLARKLAQFVTPESVIVFGPDAIHVAGEPYAPDEPARHKLLDLLGDLYVHGGAPLGTILATRPGHAATHEAMRRAWAAGVIASSETRV